MAAYLITTFLGSFLLFQVQPLIGRYILPWFGGGPAVWTTCMLFFQVMLLAGYGYAHQLTIWDRRRQTMIHLALLALALAFLPVAPSEQSWKPAAGENPIERILLLLLATIGAPYLALAATAPLVQHWFAGSFPGRSPYRLYSLSNTASLLALLSYPFLVEPNLTLAQQVSAWSWGFALFALCCGWCTWQRAPASDPQTDETAGAVELAPRGGVPVGSVLLWLALSACGSALLLASTNQLCQEVAVVPFLWVAPLALYLASYAICFNSDRAYHRVVWGILFAAALLPACWLLHVGAAASLPLQVLGYLAVLFIGCMVCHGELARSRPASRQLTLYYLTLACGGALGGTLVALAAPLVFTGFWELPIALIASALALVAAWHRAGLLQGKRWLQASAAAVIVALAGFTLSYIEEADSDTVASSRNFYGVLKVIRTSDQVGEKLYLRHGRIMHGSQYSGQRRLPTTYYGPESGAGLALRFHPRRAALRPEDRSLRVGVIGLGVGTLAVYGEKGDLFRFYEINSQVTDFADRYFSFRRDSAARIETVEGDARITMEAECRRGQAQRFDVLLVDAFSSDSIPAHLLTRECFGIYRYHLNPDGLLLVHVTNRFLNLVPVVQAQAKQMGLKAVLVESNGDRETGVAPANWMILTRNGAFLERPAVHERLTTDEEEEQPGAPLWTDDFISLWQILKW
jgi:hypothetical protein